MFTKPVLNHLCVCVYIYIYVQFVNLLIQMGPLSQFKDLLPLKAENKDMAIRKMI